MENGVLIIRLGNNPVQQYPLRRGSTSIGREAGNEIVLPVDEVSRFHARIISSPTDCKIIDANSRNGTFLNGERLKPQVEYALNHGAVVTIGPYTLRFVRVGPTRQRPVDAPAPPIGNGRRPAVFGNGRNGPQPSRPIEGRSSYWQFLPTFYEETDYSDVLNGLLRIFETILTPIDGMIDQLPYYFNPRLAPEGLLPWLAFWVDLVLNENWLVEKRRALIDQAAELYRWRGTRKGMRDYIQIYTGVEPIIVEPGQEQLSPKAPLLADVLRILKVDDRGQIDQALLERIEKPLAEHVFRVVVVVPETNPVNEALLRQIIEAEKPAHTGYELELRTIRNT